MTITFRAAELNSASGIFQQALLGQPSAEPLGGDIITRADVEFTSDDGRIQSGVWESEPGKSRWEFLTRGEIITIVSGAWLASYSSMGRQTSVASHASCSR